jgi:biopolymer transport protein ExbD
MLQSKSKNIFLFLILFPNQIKMLKFISVLVVFLLIFIISSCTTTNKIAALKPEPDNASPLIYETTPSYINLPISVKLKDVENQTNILLNGLIYDDSNIEDDNIEMKIWKLAPITIENDKNSTGEKIKTVLPLKALIKYRIGTKTMGVELYNTKEFKLNGVVTLVSDANLTNWKLSTKTMLKSLEWNESPTMVVFGKNVPVTYLINPTVKLFKSKIEKKIDEAIEKSMDFKPNVLAALEKICSPFQMSEAYESWLRIVPEEIYSTNAKLNNDTFLMEMGMKCNMETLIGSKPESKFDTSKIILKPVSKIPNQISANIAAVSTYEDASKIMTKNFAGQEFSSGSKKIKVQKVDIWHKEGKMVVALDVLGSINGTIYLNGFPQYNEQTKEIFFDQLDYVLDTKNKLMRTANWLAQGLVLKKIQESCRYSIVPNLEEGKENILKYLKNYSPMPGVFVNGKLTNIQFQKIQLTNKAIIAFIKVNGTINVAVDGLK